MCMVQNWLCEIYIHFIISFLFERVVAAHSKLLFQWRIQYRPRPTSNDRDADTLMHVRRYRTKNNRLGMMYEMKICCNNAHARCYWRQILTTTNQTFNCGCHTYTVAVLLLFFHFLSRSLFLSSIRSNPPSFRNETERITHTHIHTPHQHIRLTCNQNERYTIVCSCYHVVYCLFSGTMWATDYLADSVSESESKKWERIWKFSCTCKQNFGIVNFTFTPWKVFILHAR